MRSSFYRILLFFGVIFSTPNILATPPKPTAAQEIDKFVSLNDINSAKKYIELSLKDARINKDIANLKLAYLEIKARQKNQWQAHLKKLGESPLLQNTGLVSELYESLDKKDTQAFVDLLVKADFFDYPGDKACPFFKLTQRQKRGEFLYKILRENSLAKAVIHKILFELYVQIPESVDLRELETDKRFLLFKKNLLVKDRVERMETLMVFGKNDEARRTFSDVDNFVKLSKSDQCDLRYQNAKVERKLRRYKSALGQFEALANECDASLRQKARYMALQLMSIISDSSKLTAFDKFVADYPTHGFSDDVLIFKANILMSEGKNDAAQVVFDEVIKKFPDGDMIFQAYFMKAFDLAKRGRKEQALLTLKTMREKSAKNSLERAQAEYWLARLQIFDNLNSFDNLQKNNLAQSKLLLTDLANLKYPNVYSWLSLSLLKKIGTELVLPPLISQSRDLSSKITSNDPRLKLIEEIINNGFNKEALLLLDEEKISNSDVERALDLARLYQNVGAPSAGHQKLIRCFPEVNLALREKLPDIFINISSPQAFFQEVTWANAHVDVPKNVILAQMRQESGFLPQACSWAQAKGLMQLVFASAKEQAKKVGIPELNPENLYEPKLNLLLGSSLLMNYWQRFGHLAVALAAYNAGPQAAKKWSSEGAPIDTFIESVTFKETRLYIKSVLGSAITYARIYGEQGYSLLNFALNVDGKTDS